MRMNNLLKTVKKFIYMSILVSRLFSILSDFPPVIKFLNLYFAYLFIIFEFIPLNSAIAMKRNIGLTTPVPGILSSANDFHYFFEDYIVSSQNFN